MTRIEQDPQPDHSNVTRSTVAALLHASRVRSGQDLQDISQELCIRYSYLLAIEEGRFHTLPGAAYASGFIRSYAEHLGLDSDYVVRRFKAETEDLGHNASLAFPLPVAEKRVPTTSVVLGGVVLAAVVYVIWLWLSSGETVTELIPPVPERLASLLQDTASLQAKLTPLAPSRGLPAVPSVSPTTGGTPSHLVTITIPAPIPQSAVLSGGKGSEYASSALLPPSSRSASAQPGGGTTYPATMTNAEAGVAAGSAISPPAVLDVVATLTPVVASPLVERQAFGEQSDSSRVQLYAHNDSWIQVSDGKDILLRRTLRKGDGYYVPNRPGLLLMVGDAGAVSAWVDGVMGPPLGPAGKVRRNVSLDPDKLKVASRKGNQAASREGETLNKKRIDVFNFLSEGAPWKNHAGTSHKTCMMPRCNNSNNKDIQPRTTH